MAQVLRLLDDLGPGFGIKRAYVFGSLVKPGRFHARSDVDIAIEEINPTRFFEAMSQFSTLLGREVDLVELDPCHFADKIRREGIRWMPSV